MSAGILGVSAHESDAGTGSFLFAVPFSTDLQIAQRIDVTYENHEYIGKSPGTAWGQIKDAGRPQVEVAPGLL